MKYLLFFFLLPVFVSAQNLVPNPSFEQYDTCPDNYNQLNYASGWNIRINTPDYFNACASNFAVSIPSNGNGYQYPATGSAYAGFLGYAQSNIREYLGGNLLSPLEIGHKYFVTFKISLANGDGSIELCGINKIGILFTNISLGDTVIIPSPFINNFAHVIANNMISDTNNWITIRSSFIADSVYYYFMLGNFFDSQHIDFSCGDSLLPAYYYLDDICISEDSSMCDWIPEIVEYFAEKNIIYYPNPANERIIIQTDEIINTSCILINQFGIKSKPFIIYDKTSIDVSSFPPGLYLLEIHYGNKVIQKKQLILH